MLSAICLPIALHPAQITALGALPVTFRAIDLSGVLFNGILGALIARRKKSDPDDTHNSPEAQERWVRAAEHPNEEDRAAAREFVHKMEHKLDLLEKFRQAQEARQHAAPQK